MVLLLKREETKSSIVCTAAQAEKSILPFCCVAPGITAIGRRAYGLRVLDERKAGEREHRECTTKNIRFCFRRFFPFIYCYWKDCEPNVFINDC